jgi:hypothetical protein
VAGDPDRRVPPRERVLIVAWIERRELEQRGRSGRPVVRYQVRYRDHAGKVHTETRRRLIDAERRKAELELELANGSWLDPRRGEIRLAGLGGGDAGCRAVGSDRPESGVRVAEVLGCCGG